MRPIYILLLNIFILMVLQSCNTLYNTGVINIEVVEPGKVIIPTEYKNVAVKYNNINVAPNPYQEKGSFIGKEVFDDQNTDSIASEVYYGYFVDELRKQAFFDSVIEIKPQDYSRINIVDTNHYKFNASYDSIVTDEQLSQQLNVFRFSKAIHEYPNNEKSNSDLEISDNR